LYYFLLFLSILLQFFVPFCFQDYAHDVRMIHSLDATLLFRSLLNRGRDGWIEALALEMSSSPEMGPMKTGTGGFEWMDGRNGWDGVMAFS